ncbi:MAG: glucohydrolase, partial [Clostridium sp.]
EPWIEMNPNYNKINVEAQLDVENSILSFYKKMAKLRKENLGLVYGIYDLILPEDKQIYAYTRSFKDNSFIIIGNLSDKEASYKYDGINLEYNNLLLSNYEVEQHGAIDEIVLKPYEARIYRIDDIL